MIVCPPRINPSSVNLRHPPSPSSPRQCPSLRYVTLRWSMEQILLSRKKRRVKTFLQRVTDYRRGEKRRSFSSPEEEKRNETKFIYKDEFDPLSIIQPFRLEKLPERSLKEEVVRKREHHLLACLKFISQKGIPITYFFRVRRFSMINY